MSRVEDEELRRRLEALGYEEGGYVYKFPIKNANFTQLIYEIEKASGLLFLALHGHASYDGETLEITSRRKLTSEELTKIETAIMGHTPTELNKYLFKKTLEINEKILNRTILITIWTREPLTSTEIRRIEKTLESEHMKVKT